MRYAWLFMVCLGCGTSPEFLDEPEWPEDLHEDEVEAQADAATPAQPYQGPEASGRCDGSTGFTRLKGRLDRGVGVEGFGERSCR